LDRGEIKWEKGLVRQIAEKEMRNANRILQENNTVHYTCGLPIKSLENNIKSKYDYDNWLALLLVLYLTTMNYAIPFYNSDDVVGFVCGCKSDFFS
jgi:hypothetical protein